MLLEELIIENTEKAEKVCKKQEMKLFDYSVAPYFSLDKQAGRHEWMIEFKKSRIACMPFGDFGFRIVTTVQTMKKRFKNITLNPPLVHITRENLFTAEEKRNQEDSTRSLDEE